MKASKIRLLSPELVHRIAAGEVVENPASAMKELIENSIDAGAAKVSTLIIDGGLKLIEVKDDGFGMSQQDLESCCQRHATSKIREVEDLDHIFSLGFRGEALAALSSVSHLEILSRELGSSEGWLLKRQGAQFETQPASASVGSIVRIHDLFFNTPARKKFLKSSASEASKCVKVFKDLAVAHPNVELSLHLLSAEGEVEEDLHFKAAKGDSARLFRMSALLGKDPEFFLNLSKSNLVAGLKKIESVFLHAPHFLRNSKDIFFVVNGRPVEDKRLAYVLREAFGGLIEVGSFPRGAIYLDVDDSEVDVNVHPQKKELRWSKDFPLYSLIYEQIKRGLNEQSKRGLAEQGFSLPKPSEPEVEHPRLELGGADFSPSGVAESYSFSSFYTPHATQLVNSQNAGSCATSTSTTHVFPKAPAKTLQFSSLRVVGEVGAAWLVCEAEAGLILIDQHAAHERVRFDEFLKGKELFTATPLLLPLKLELSLALKGKEEEFLDLLEPWCFEGRVLGDRELEFYAIPKSARKIEWSEIFHEIFDRMDQNESVESLRERLRIWMASSLACHGSVRRGQRLTNPEIQELLKKMDAVDWKEFCPHGRPTWISFPHSRLEEEFHRS